MNDKRIEKHFDKLTKRERAILMLNAFGRKDERECARLVDAAPRATFSAPDFRNAMMLLTWAIEWHALKQSGDAANLFLIMSLADADPDPEKYPDPDGAVRVIAYNIITRAAGWKIFCGELGLDPIGALRIVSADTHLLGMAEEIARAVKPDVDALRAKLRETFPQFNGEPKTAEEVATEYRSFLNVRP